MSRLVGEQNPSFDPTLVSGVNIDPVEVHSLRRKLAAVAAAGLLSVAALLAPQNEPVSEQTYIQEGDQNAMTCPEVSPRSLALAKSLISMPENPLIKEIEDWHATQLRDQDSSLPSQMGVGHVRSVEYDIRKTMADQLGLTVFDPRPTYETFFDTARTHQQLLEAADTFMKQYGISVRLSNDPKRRPSPAEVDLWDTKATLYSIVMGFAAYPLEFVKQGDTVAIELTNTGSWASGGTGKQRPPGNKDGVLYFNLYAVPNSDIVTHEYYHSWERNVCGTPDAAGNDPGFARFNSSDERKASYTVVEYDEQAKVLRNKQRAARHGFKRDYLKICEMEKNVAVFGVNTRATDDYDRTGENPELKANLARAFINNQHLVEYTDHNVPALRRGLEYVAGRLAQTKDGPKILRYFMQTSQRFPGQSFRKTC